MRVLHTVTFKTKPDVTTERISKLRQLFSDCLGVCDGLEWIKFGSNISSSQFAKGWTETVLLLFRDREARDAYLPHAMHKRVSEEAMNGFFSEMVVFDAEVDL